MAGLTDKTLRMMAESTTGGLWDERGQMVFATDLGLQPATIKRLAAWSTWFEEFEGHLPASKRTPPLFPLDAFNTEGRAIAALIQSELPDWAVTYEDEPSDFGEQMRIGREFMKERRDVFRELAKK